MDIFEAIILGIIQGLTEFIPVSSSGHLLLAQHLLGTQEAGLAFDVALHIGTLAALFIFFHKDVLHLCLGILGKNDSKRLAWLIVFATIPAVIGGYLLQDAAESSFRSPWLVSINLILIAFAMLGAEKYASRQPKHTKIEDTTTKQALAVGVAQTIALVPGISRSGITITTGIFAGLDRVSATRFSFLLAIPITTGAILKVLSDSGTTAQLGQEQGIFIAGILASFLSGLFAIKFLIGYLSKHTLAVFAYYRIGLGLLVMLFLAI